MSARLAAQYVPHWPHFGKYLALVRISVLNKLSYAGDVLARTIFILLILFIFSELWLRALPNGADLAGFVGTQMVWYLLLTEAITLSLPHMESAITDDVKSGGIAYQLTRPYSYVGYYLAVSYGDFMVRWPVNLLLGSGLCWLLAGTPDIELRTLPLVVLAALLGAGLSFLFTISLALTAFWFEENRPFFWIYSKMIFTLGGLFVPTEVYPGFLHTIAIWSPFEYMVSAPARLFVRFDMTFWQRVAIGQIAWLAVLSIVVVAVYRTGVKRVNVHGG